MDMQPGQQIGDYELLGTLGAGGMGTVYKVRSSITHRIEALKVLLPNLDAQSDLVERFLREIRISAGLDHPNIAALRAAQRDGNRLLMVMEFVEGNTLAELMQRGRLPLHETLGYMSQALAALDYAHARGVIHRDIKPSNIMVTPSGQVKLMDFGVAKLSSDNKLTKTGFLVGSLHYMSPEQIEGKDLDARSDLYSLGVTFYEMVTGTRPFTGDSEYQIMAAHLKGEPQPPLELAQNLPPHVSDLILTALSRDPATRFGSAKAMKAAVDGLRGVNGLNNNLETQPLTHPPAPKRATPVPANPAKRSHRTAYMLAGSLATVAVLALAVVEVPNLLHTKANTAVTQPVVQTDKPVRAPTPTVVQPSSPATVDSGAVDNSSKPTRQSRMPRTITEEPKVTDPPRKLETAAPVKPPGEGDQSASKPPAVDNQQLESLRDRMGQMDARVTAVRSSLDNLQREQAASGLSLRTDMVAAQQHLLYLMSEAETNIRNQDAANAGKHLDAADIELSKLENFLGR